ncbi:galactose metabolism- protein [Dionaea muscipula]
MLAPSSGTLLIRSLSERRGGHNKKNKKGRFRVMGNAHGSGEEEAAAVDPAAIGRSNAGSAYANDHAPNRSQPVPVASSESMGSSPPASPGRSQSPLLFTPEFPVPPLRSSDGSPLVFNQAWQAESHGQGADAAAAADFCSDKGIPILITWSHGGNNVAVEGSWDNWTSRKTMQRSGKDHSLLLVLPSGIYHYKFFIDGESRYIPQLPCTTNDFGLICNVLDVHDYVPESLDGVAEFEAPQSPDSSYGQAFPGEDEFGKEPVMVPSQAEATVLGMPNSSDVTSRTRPQHVVLNHLFIEKGWATQSVVALGLTHRFQSKYVTVVLYKPLKR